MSPSIFQLVYFSRASPNLSDVEVGGMIDHARSYNLSNGITGLLLYEQGHFMQLVEGEEDAVGELYSRIKTDSRHSHIVTVYSGDSANRDFAGWDMAHGRIGLHQEELKSAFQSLCSVEERANLTSIHQASVNSLIQFFRSLLNSSQLRPILAEQ